MTMTANPTLHKSDAYKTVGDVYRICDMPQGYVMGFRRKPFSTPDNNSWMVTSETVKSKQYVLVIESLSDEVLENLGQNYYRVIADEGFYWIHGFDLIRVDPATGDITANSR